MPPVIRHKDGVVFVDNTPLQDVALQETYLTADVAAAAAAITVKNIAGFGINQLLLIEDIGSENADLATTHASTAPTGTTITLITGDPIKAHSAGTKVYRIPYDLVEITHATTTTGTRTALTSITNGMIEVTPDIEVQKIPETEYLSGYYFARYVHSVGKTFTAGTNDVITCNSHGLKDGDTIKVISSSALPAGLTTGTVYYVISAATNTFSVSLTSGGSAVDITDTGTGTHTWYQTSTSTDALPYGGWTTGTVGSMIESALDDLDLTLSEKITKNSCYRWLNDGMTEIKGKLRHWPEHFTYNAILGQLTRGTFQVAMPTDAYDLETNKSLISVRVGDSKSLIYLDPIEFENQMSPAVSTQVRVAGSSGATSLAVDNSYDFADSGSLNFYISGTKYTITYTAITRDNVSGATAAFTGVPASGTGSISVTIPVDTNIWQEETEGTPIFYTVLNSYLEFWPLPDATEDNVNVYADYAKVVTAVDSDGDTIDFQRYDMLKSYLSWRIKMKAKNNGALDINDGYYIEFKTRLNDAIRTLPQNITYKWMPKLNKMSKGSGRSKEGLFSTQTVGG